MMMKKLCLMALIAVVGLAFSACGITGDTSTAGEAASQETAAAPGFEEKVFTDDENCVFKITAIEEDNIFGYTLKANLENKSDKNLMFAWNDVSVNGYMCDPFWATSVQAGKKAVSDISFATSSLEELGIETVETIEFTLSVYDEDDWMAEHLVEETYTLDLQN